MEAFKIVDDYICVSRDFLQQSASKWVGDSMTLLLYILLRKDEWCVDELCVEFGMSESVVSKHINKLNRLGYLEILEEQKTEEKKRTRKERIPEDVRWLIFERDNFTCKHCGSRRKLSVDHIHPESLGGTLAKDNLQTLCKSCNSKKGTKNEENLD
jgi:DNA-binding transcriptional ArsR family regulator